MSFELGSPADLVAHLLVAHHAYLHDNLDRLASLAAAAVETHDPAHHEVVAVTTVFGRFYSEMELHLAHEESRIFPAITALCPPGAKGVRPDAALLKWLDGLEAEHEYQAADLDELSELTGGFTILEDTSEIYRTLLCGLADLERDTREHVRFENEELFPRVRALAVPGATAPPRGF